MGIETYTVRTPKPYTVDLEHYETGAEKKRAIRRLEKAVAFLNNILDRLGITREEARGKNYTLNIATGDRLRGAARARYQASPTRKNHETVMMIQDHDW